jgi:hypothetical protein
MWMVRTRTLRKRLWRPVWPCNQAKKRWFEKTSFGNYSAVGSFKISNRKCCRKKKLATDLFECAKRALCSVKSEMRCPQNLLAKLALLLKPEERLLQHVAGKELRGVHRWCIDGSFRRSSRCVKSFKKRSLSCLNFETQNIHLRCPRLGPGRSAEQPSAESRKTR